MSGSPSPGQSFLQVMHPILYISRLLGLLPVTFAPRGAEPQTLRKTPSGMAYSVTAALLMLAGLSKVVFDIYSSRSSSAIITVTSIAKITVYCLNVVFTISSAAIANLKYPSQMGRALHLLDKVDRDIFMDTKRLHAKVLKLQYVEIAALFLLGALIGAYVRYVMEYDILECVMSFLILWITIPFTELCFVNLSFVLKHRFEQLHVELKKCSNYKPLCLRIQRPDGTCRGRHTLRENRWMGSVKEGSPIIGYQTLGASPRVVRPLRDIPRLKVLRRVHDRLLDVSDLTYDMFGIQLLLSVCINFIDATITLYVCIAMVSLLSTDHRDYANYSLPLYVTIVVKNVAQLVAVMGSAGSVAVRADHTVSVLQTMTLERGLETDSQLELQLFLQQAVNRRVRPSACGFFGINGHVLGSILGTMATFLIVLVQLKLT